MVFNETFIEKWYEACLPLLKNVLTAKYLQELKNKLPKLAKKAYNECKDRKRNYQYVTNTFFSELIYKSVAGFTVKDKEGNEIKINYKAKTWHSKLKEQMEYRPKSHHRNLCFHCEEYDDVNDKDEFKIFDSDKAKLQRVEQNFSKTIKHAIYIDKTSNLQRQRVFVNVHVSSGQKADPAMQDILELLQEIKNKYTNYDVILGGD